MGGQQRGAEVWGPLCLYSLSYMGMKLPIGPRWSIGIFFDQKQQWTHRPLGWKCTLLMARGGSGPLGGTIWHSALIVHAVYTSYVSAPNNNTNTLNNTNTINNSNNCAKTKTVSYYCYTKYKVSAPNNNTNT